MTVSQRFAPATFVARPAEGDPAPVAIDQGRSGPTAFQVSRQFTGPRIAVRSYRNHALHSRSASLRLEPVTLTWRHIIAADNSRPLGAFDRQPTAANSPLICRLQPDGQNRFGN